MEPDKENQQELFEEFKEPQRRKFGFKNMAYYPKGVLHISLSYEKTLFLLIGFIIILVIIFTMGIEKGKRLSGQITTLRQQEEFSPVKKHSMQTKLMPVASIPTPAAKPYTIQVASLTNYELAQKEVDKLKRQGYEASLVKTDKYYVVLVGSFSNKDEADALLSKLKSIYKGCFIRKR